jgi:hypothetical protein
MVLSTMALQVEPGENVQPTTTPAKAMQQGVLFVWRTTGKVTTEFG